MVAAFFLLTLRLGWCSVIDIAPRLLSTYRAGFGPKGPPWLCNSTLP